MVFITLAIVAQKPKVKNDPTHDDKLIHFGFSIGINAMDYHFLHSELAKQDNIYTGLHKMQAGINIHAIGNLRLAEYFDLRFLPGISFGERNIYYINLHDSSIYQDDYYRMESSYLEFPLSIKYKSKRLNNFRPYLLGGGNVRYDLAVKKEYDIKDQLFMVEPLQFYGEIGMGFDFYLVYFKFSIELKYSIGINNIMRHQNPGGERPPDELADYSDYIKQLHSNIFILSFHFE